VNVQNSSCIVFRQLPDTVLPIAVIVHAVDLALFPKWTTVETIIQQVYDKQ